MCNLNAIAQCESRNPNSRAIFISSALGLRSIQSRKRTSIKLFRGTLVVRKTCSRRIHAPYGMVLHFGQIEEGFMSEAKVTTDHNEIRIWVEARGGQPARV